MLASHSRILRVPNEKSRDESDLMGLAARATTERLVSGDALILQDSDHHAPVFRLTFYR
jgi:hypothetical protein